MHNLKLYLGSFSFIAKVVQYILNRLSIFQSQVSGQRALIIRSDELEVTSARARGQVCVIIVSAAKSSRAPPPLRNLEADTRWEWLQLHQTTVWAFSCDKTSRPDDEDEGQEESGNGHQRDDQIKRQFGAALVARHVFQFWNFSQVI